MTTGRVVEQLRLAYRQAPGCPVPEVFLEASWRELPAAERMRLEEHAKRCPACSAERELAAAFDATSVSSGTLDEDVSFVVSQLKNPARLGPRGATRDVTGARRVHLAARFWLAAAAAVLFIAIGVRTYRSLGPALPPPSPETTTRGAVIDAIDPVGEIAGLPGALRWSTVPGAASYRVRLTAVDATSLWDTAVQGTTVDLPPSVRGRLHEAVVYSWEVDAFDARGARIGASGSVEFRAAPRSEPVEETEGK